MFEECGILATDFLPAEHLLDALAGRLAQSTTFRGVGEETPDVRAERFAVTRGEEETRNAVVVGGDSCTQHAFWRRKTLPPPSLAMQAHPLAIASMSALLSPSL